jgi:hypothetical protein
VFAGTFAKYEPTKTSTERWMPFGHTLTDVVFLILIAIAILHPYTMSGPLAPPPDLIGQSSLYNHPDPLLRRLRLDDSSGGSVTNLDTTFKGKEILILYAGSEHGSSRSLARYRLFGQSCADD